jgi:ElaB/YqjD/DUF883 family membrane-anchored ribosome-binding protein
MDNLSRESLHNPSNKMGSMASNFVHSTSEYVKSGREYVVENPAKGVALAAAAGAVVASILMLTMKRKH